MHTHAIKKELTLMIEKAAAAESQLNIGVKLPGSMPVASFVFLANYTAR